MTFSREADCLKLLTRGPWFYGRSMFSLTTYERKEDPATVSIRGFPTWVEILGIPLWLMTEEAVEKISSTLGDVIHSDKNNKRQARWRWLLLGLRMRRFLGFARFVGCSSNEDTSGGSPSTDSLGTLISM
ncbi:hypothetical protein ACLB2K_065418 [Fragaria x ananassa]